jgi:hypothetical protein
VAQQTCVESFVLVNRFSFRNPQNAFENRTFFEIETTGRKTMLEFRARN